MRWIHAFQFGSESEGVRQLKALPCAKHASAYDLEGWGSGHGGNFNASEIPGLQDGRAGFNAVISDRDQVEYYWPAWRAAVQGGRVGSIMCSVSRQFHKQSPVNCGLDT